jgi:hypothetical protein
VLESGLAFWVVVRQSVAGLSNTRDMSTSEVTRRRYLELPWGQRHRRCRGHWLSELRTLYMYMFLVVEYRWLNRKRLLGRVFAK